MIVASLLLLGVGVAAGWFAAKQSCGPTQPNTPAISYIADADVLAPAPSWEEWKYPGSRPHRTATGGGSKVGEIEFSEAERIALVTPDEFDRVWAFYKDKCKLRDLGNDGSTRRIEVGSNVQGVTAKVFEDVHAHTLEGPNSDGVQARGFSVQSPRYSLVGFVYRPKGGDSTSILLVYRPNTEFIGLLKERLAKN